MLLLAISKKKEEKEINGNGLYNGYSLFPFGDNSYLTLDEMHEKIKNY
jgi:hypothetical protein